MKRLICALVVVMLLIGSVSAADSNVTYDGETQKFIFEPGCKESLTDLFPNFKDVMPGDVLTQTITVRNEQSNQVKVEIFIRSLGAQEGSEEFLSQLKLKVAKSEENNMGYMFDAYADETAQLTDWVCLGMLYSGGEVALDVTLEVPTSMDNTFKNAIGYLDWEFKVVEYPIEEDDPKPPQTGDDTNLTLPIILAVACAAGVILLILWRKRERGGDEDE